MDQSGVRVGYYSERLNHRWDPFDMRIFDPGAKHGLVALLAATATVAVVDAQPPLDLKDCRVNGVSVPARCGSLTVFEDRATGAGRTIDLKIVVIPAVSGSPEPDPLFFLAGGPGQAATDLAERVLARLAEVRRNRDIVFVDQRGTGGSGRMSCALFESGSDEGTSGESLQLDTLPLDDLRDCLAEIESATDPRHYTTPVAMDDLDDVRAALGYETINLYGGSYGTRVDNDQEAVLIARATVWRALDTLPPRRRAVVVMHELEGLTISAIASLLRISAITVRWHLSVSRRALARVLRPQMGDTNEDP